MSGQAPAIRDARKVGEGGPGSGRHKEHGSFEKTGKAGRDTYYKGSGGTVVRVNGPKNPMGKTTVDEGGKKIWQGYRGGGASQDNDFHSFMKDRYGISHESKKEAATPKGPQVAPRYDKSHDEGFVDHRYPDLKKGVGESATGKTGWTARQRAMHSKMGQRIAKRSMESRRDFDDGTPRPIDLKTLYQQPEYKPGWTNSNIYSPATREVAKALTNPDLVIKEF